jgi:GNAT superfamily N-acetyltransferase
VVITNTRAEHAGQLEELQRLVFPSLRDDERFKAAQYRKHIELFAEGQFVALDAGRVVAANSAIRCQFDFDHPAHTFEDFIQGGWLTTHDPTGPWMYGVDTSVHPGWRRRGLATALYQARLDLIRTLGLKGLIGAGMMSGYGAVKGQMSAEEYFEGLKSGRIVDPTLTMQLGVGFEIRALLPGYLHDPVCDDYCVLIVLDAAKAVSGGTAAAT